MMSSQLGRVILSSVPSTEDEMRSRPGADGGYGLLDEYLEEIAAEMGGGSAATGEPRPGGSSS